MAKLRGDVPLICSFCGKREDAGRKIVPGPGVSICDHCIQLCREYLSAYKPAVSVEISGDIPTPA